MMSEQAGECLISVAANAIHGSPQAFAEVLNKLAAPIYLTDSQGTLTYFNDACVKFAGRTPRLKTDKWCVTWKLYRSDGEYLPHVACPMAVAIRERRPIRGVQAIAERPDGTFINFTPFPTPLFDDEGKLTGAVNLLLDITSKRSPENWAITRVRGAADDELRSNSIEALARLSARIAGRDPEDHVKIKLGDITVFDDLTWRYPDFLARAEAAYRLLESDDLPE